MSATSPVVDRPRADSRNEAHTVPALRSTETKASFKTTEFFAYIAILVAIFVAGAVTKAGSHHADVFGAGQVWLYATILTIGYMVSRGLAKAASREPHADER